MIKLSKRRSPGRQKSMCFAAKGRLQGRAAKLLLVCWQSWHNIAALQVTASGYEQKALVAQPADTSPGTLASKLSRRARHHGAIFASPGERLNCLS
jgi:hypothetical protein